MHKRPIHKLKSMFYVCSGATCVFSAMCYYQENEKFYENVLLPVVHNLDPELSHNLAVKASKYGLLPRSKFEDPPVLESSVWGLMFKNPIGMAAGFDKNAEAIQGLHKIGFSFVEIGSVTPLPQPGNDKPRVFRLSANKAIINRYGFNSDGHEAVVAHVQKVRDSHQGIIGVNLGKNKDSPDPVADYKEGIRLFAPLADYLVINVSSPNTPGLRDLQKKDQLEFLLSQLKSYRDIQPVRPPLLLKLAPDLSEQESRDIAELVLRPNCRVDGLIICNTSTERSADLEGESVHEAGGLSGAPLLHKSTSMIARIYHLTHGKIPIIGVGGVFSGEDALAKIKAGASLVQLYTAFIYHGPPRVTRVRKELAHLLQSEGYKNVSEAVGANNKPGREKIIETSASAGS